MKHGILILLLGMSAGLHAEETPPAQNAPAAQQAQNTPLTAQEKHEDDLSPAEAKVKISTQKDMTIEEYRVSGRLYMIKITPKHGKPYYLVDDRGDGRFVRQDGLDSGFRVPRWVIKKF